MQIGFVHFKHTMNSAKNGYRWIKTIFRNSANIFNIRIMCSSIVQQNNSTLSTSSASSFDALTTIPFSFTIIF